MWVPGLEKSIHTHTHIHPFGGPGGGVFKSFPLGKPATKGGWIILSQVSSWSLDLEEGRAAKGTPSAWDELGEEWSQGTLQIQ